MKPTYVTRNTLRLLSKNSHISKSALKRGFAENGVNADLGNWIKFLKITALSLGVVFCLSGIIFFLAYNWHLMHRFLKLGLVQALVLIIVLSALLLKNLKPQIRDFLLMSASVLVGAMFSVFGQIYQTGADAYDFFLGWTVFVFVWAIAANFYPLWLLLLVLINTTFLFFVSQAGPNWSFGTNLLILSAFDAAVMHALQALSKRQTVYVPTWFSRVLELGVACFITFGMLDYIDGKDPLTWLFTSLALLTYSFSVYTSFKQHGIFSLCVVSLSVIAIICGVIHELIGSGASSFFFQSVFVIACVTILLRWLIILNRNWNGIN